MDTKKFSIFKTVVIISCPKKIEANVNKNDTQIIVIAI